jgi:hypothetical protein
MATLAILVQPLSLLGRTLALGAALAATAAGASPFKLEPADGTIGDQFGQAVAISGNTAVVGAISNDAGGLADSGAAYVYVRSGSGWVQQQKLTALDGASRDGFGSAVAIEGDTLVVGAWGDESFRGAAYVFTRSNGVWVQQKLVAPDGVVGDRFGVSLAISNDTIVVAAPFHDTDGLAPFGNGALYVFVRSGGIWLLQQKLTASDAGGGELLGRSVAIDGDTIVAGAEFEDVVERFDNRGAAYVFVRANGIWSQQQKLVASDAPFRAQFGSSVALSGNTTVVGAEADDIGGSADQGSAYVFTRASGVWTEQQKLTASDGAARDKFGFYVAVRGDTIAVGAETADVGANVDQGAVYVFAPGGGAWIEQTKLVAPDGTSSDRFGTAVAIGSLGTVVGAWGDEIFRGSAYVFATATPAETIQALIDAIVANPNLAKGAKTSLTAPLEPAIRILSDDNPGNDRAACGQLNAFANHLSAPGRVQQIGAGLVDEWRATARAIQAALDCSG